MTKRQPRDHYCKICGEYKTNEKFSGKGHAAHICKACSKLSAAEKAEAETLSRLMNLPMGRLRDDQKKWLEARVHDHRPAVSSLAQEIYNAHFPYAERNARKKQLLINRLNFEIHTNVYDEIGDEVAVDLCFIADRESRTLTMINCDTDKRDQVTIDGGRMAKLLRWMVHTLEIFMWDRDYGQNCASNDLDADLLPDFWPGGDEAYLDAANAVEDGLPYWRVQIAYSNHTEQDIISQQDFLEDGPEELYFELLRFFDFDTDVN